MKRFNRDEGILMKKNISLIPVLLALGACAGTEDSTLQNVIFDDGEITEVREATVSRQAPVKEIALPETEVEIVVDEPGTYQLPTRAERYEENAPTAEVYAIPAARATNRMLDESREFYEHNGDTFLFITDIKKGDRKLPDGIYNAERTTRKIIEGSKTFKVVNDKAEADYILETIIDNAGTPEEPILVYRMILLDTENNKINEWTEVFRRLSNDDRSWW